MQMLRWRVQNTKPVQLEKYPLLRSGKVRDIYDAGDTLLLVASDRLSAFDVILPTPILDKGVLLTAIAEYWFERTEDICPNHLISTDVATLDLSPDEARALRGRTMIGRKADRIDIECVVRGYLAGSGYKEYATSGTLAGESLPPKMELGDALPEPRFTPAIKNDEGHDQNISRQQLKTIIGADLAGKLEAISLQLFSFATERAARAGFVLADTKFEFGMVDGKLIVIDEILTPDSSRYWEASMMESGKEPPSFDKQIIRDWLETQPWNKTAPGPEVPTEIIEKARERYETVLNRLKRIPDEQE